MVKDSRVWVLLSINIKNLLTLIIILSGKTLTTLGYCSNHPSNKSQADPWELYHLREYVKKTLRLKRVCRWW